MEITRTVLVIAYYFPPLGLSGVQRTLKFVKYLPEFGWHPIVLTVEPRGYFAQDESLLAELDGADVEVVRTRSIDPLHFARKKKSVRIPSARTYNALGKISSLFFVPDNKIGWKKYALAAAEKIIGERQIDVVYATAPPYTDFIIGRELKRRRALPLVIDYRDAWIDNPLHFYATPFHRYAHTRLERSVIRHADRIVTINRAIKELLIHRYDSLTHREIDIIPQGYDEKDFSDAPSFDRDGKMHFTHSGTFYYNRTPKFFFLALRALFQRRPELAKKIDAWCIGNVAKEHRAMIEKLGLGDQVRFFGYVPHKEAVEKLMQSDVLWMMLGGSKGDEMMSTGKLFEYLGARKPILGCVPDGIAKKTIRESGAGFIVPPTDVDAISLQIEKLYELWKTSALPRPKEEYVRRYERRELTGTLARVLNAALRVDEEVDCIDDDSVQ